MLDRSGGNAGVLVETHDEAPITLSRIISDTLTAVRFVLSGFITIMGMVVGPRALTAALILVLIGWFTDVFDGPVSRRRPDSRKTLLSRADFAADLALIYSFLLFVVITGLLPIWLALLYVVPGSAIAFKRPTQTTMMIISAPLFGVPLLVSFAVSLPLGICFVGFAVVTGILRSGKLKQEISESKQEIRNPGI